MRMLGWMSRLLLTTLLASTVSMLSTWTVIQLYVERVLEAYELPSAELDVKFSDFLAQAVRQWPNHSVSRDTPGLRDEVNRILVHDQTEVSQEPDYPEANEREDQEKSVQGDAEGERNGDTEVEQGRPDAVAVWGSGIVEEADSEQGQDRLYISAQEFNEKREKLSDEDKWTIFTLVMSKLPKEELQAISAYMENGITEAEMEELLTIMETYLDEADMDQLLEIMSNYS